MENLKTHGIEISGGIKIIGNKEANITREVLDMIYDNLDYKQSCCEINSVRYWELQDKKAAIANLIDLGLLR